MELSDCLDGAVDAAMRAPREWRQATLGEQLRALRAHRGMSQRHVAEGARLDPATVGRLERGADARWETWRRVFFSLGYEPVMVPVPGDEGVEDMISDEIQQRQDRAEAGRGRRWG